MTKKLFLQRNVTKRLVWLSVLIAILLLPLGAWAQDVEASYWEFDTGTRQFTEKTCTDGVLVTASSYSWDSGKTYVVNSDVTIGYRISISGGGAVSLILCDGATLTASQGIDVPQNSTLTIYAQSEGTGTLVASGYYDYYDDNNQYNYGAAIGGDAYELGFEASNPNSYGCGAIYIHGGQITANSSNTNYAAGIGGCYSDGGTVVIYGGTVIATGSSDGAGIGSGGTESLNDGTLTLGDGITCYGGEEENPTDNAVTGPIENVTQRYRYMKTTYVAPISYGITVGGVLVTSANAEDVTGGGIYAGSVSYNADSNTLTLSSATISSGGVTSEGDLNLSVNGEQNYINGNITSSKAGGAVLTFKHDDENTANLQLNLSGFGNLSGFTSVIYDGMYLTDTNERDIKFSPTRQQFEVNPYAPSSTVKLSSAKTYELWLGGTKVTEANKENILGSQGETATASFNPITSTLTLSGMTLQGTSIWDDGIISRLDDLTIVINGSNTIVCSDSCTAIRADKEGDQTLSIINGSLDSDFKFKARAIIRDFISLTLTDLEWDNEYTYKYVEISGYDPGYKLVNANDEEVNAFFLDTQIVTLSHVKDGYGLTVGGVEVGIDNASNIVGDNISGTVSFNPETNILTLDNATIDMSNSDAVPVVSSLSDLTVHLIGTNTIKLYAQSNFRCAFISQVLTMAGTLTFTTDENPNGCNKLIVEGITSIDDLALGFDLYNDFGEGPNSGVVAPEDGDDTPDGWMNCASVNQNALHIWYFKGYNLWIGDYRVTSDNINGYQPATHTLPIAEYTDESITSSLEELTIEVCNQDGMINIPTNYQGTTPPAIEFVPVVGDVQSGTLSIKSASNEAIHRLALNSEGGAIVGFSNVIVVEPIVVKTPKEAPITWDSSITTAVFADYDDYDITVITADSEGSAIENVITNLNAADVLNDGTVSYDSSTNILTLNNANFGSSSGALYVGANSLTIHLVGNSTIKSMEGFINGQASPITFTTDEKSPGSLTFQNYYNDPENPSVYLEMLFDCENVVYENHLVLTPNVEGPVTAYTIAWAIPPITDKEDPNNAIVIDNTNGDYDDLDGVIISDVYYTLTDEQGWYDSSDGVTGVVVKVGMTDVEVDAAIAAGKPGDEAFDALYRGITLMVPAGIGTVTVTAKGESGSVLMTKVGTAIAVEHELSTTDYENIEIPYSCTEPTYVYVYLRDQTSATSRSGGPRPYKVQTTSVKVTGYKGNSSAVVSVDGTQTASVYSLSCIKGYNDGDEYVEMSTVEVAPMAAAPSRGLSSSSSVTYDITELGNDVFTEITDKSIIRYINLADTKVEDIHVNRTSGIFNGFPDATVIYLPENNFDNDQPNVIVDGVCKTLTLSDDKPFQAPAGMNFTVDEVKLSRTFASGITATVFLPFTIPAAQASALGTFHTFKEIAGNNAVFNDAETGDIVANTPYIFVPGSSLSSIDVTNVTVTGLGSTTANDGTLFGTYERIEWDTDPADIYGFAAKEENGLTPGVFFKVKAGSYVPPFRAYLEVTSAPSRLYVVIGDENLTGITTMSKIKGDADVWYSLDGRRREGKPVKQGIYIHNNKKVIVR